MPRNIYALVRILAARVRPFLARARARTHTHIHTLSPLRNHSLTALIYSHHHRGQGLPLVPTEVRNQRVTKLSSQTTLRTNKRQADTAGLPIYVANYTLGVDTIKVDGPAPDRNPDVVAGDFGIQVLLMHPNTTKVSARSSFLSSTYYGAKVFVGGDACR